LKLKDSLKKAFDSILERNSSSGNVIANSTQLSTNSLVFQGVYSSDKWSGELVAYPVTDTGLSLTPRWKSSDAGKIPGWNARRIFYGSDTLPFTGKEFLWGQLSDTEKSLASGIGTEAGLQYVRGNQTQEIKNGGIYRDRTGTNVLGDIVHSSPFYVADSNTVFVGANDGMLHAFDADTGGEHFSYIPRALIPKVKALTVPSYNENHQYFVDGDIVVSAVAQTGRNYLVASMGRGAKGLFGLDVTNPSSFAASNVKWEYTDPADADLGHMLGAPLIAQMKNGAWAVIVSNGYNSTNEGAALYIFDLASGDLIKKIDTGASNRGNNGLAAPGLKLDSSGKVEAIYAGDLRGNVWKFDVSDGAPSAWGLAFSGVPFFQARDASMPSLPQPITAPITGIDNTVVGNPNFGKWFIHFGTGSYFKAGDPSSTTQQSWYGLIDSGAPIADHTNLVRRTFSVATTFNGKRVRSLSAPGDGDMDSKSGFFIDLPESGERIVFASTYGVTSQPIILASSAVPIIDVCIPGGRGYINIIDPFSGGQLKQANLDINNNGDFTDDVVNGTYFTSFDPEIGIPSQPRIIGTNVITGGTGDPTTGKTISNFNLLGAPVGIRGRQSWREIIVD
jgi:type IV pilus assembly protein PilY1